jgi:hypothetical protein
VVPAGSVSVTVIGLPSVGWLPELVITAIYLFAFPSLVKRLVGDGI